MQRLAWWLVGGLAVLALGTWLAGRPGPAMSLFLAGVLVGILNAALRGPDHAMPGDHTQRSDTSVLPPSH